MIKKINYENKVAIQNDEDIENKNKVTDDDMNEIKKVVNNNADELNTAQENISDIQEEQETQNTKIETLETDNTTNKKDISDLKEENETQSTNIEELQTNLSDAQQEIDALRTIQNALPTVDGEGENVKLVGTAENTTFKKFQICGNSEQESREGYNLLDINNGAISNNCTMTQISESEYKVTVKNSADWARIDIPLSLISTKTYRASLYTKVSDANARIEIGTYYNNTQYGTLFSNNSTDYTKQTISSVPTSINRFTIWLNPDSISEEFDVYIKEPMLYEGTEEKEYEAYGASPSPDFPSEIETVGGDINQFNKDEVVLKDGYYSSTDNGNFVQSNTTCHTENFIKVIPNTNYILSRFKRHSSSYNYPSVYAIYFYDNEKNWISRTSAFYTSNSAPINEYLEYQFKTPSNCRYIRFQCQTTEINLDLDTIELKLEEYIGTASVEKCNKNIIDLLSEDLTSGGWHTGSTYNENNVKVLKSPYNSGKNWNSFYFLNEKIVGKNVSISFDIKVNNLEYISLLSLQNTASYGSGTIEGIKKFITKNDTYVHVKINNYLVTTNMLAFFVQSSYVEGTENDSIYIYIKNFQIEKNSVATDYVEHQEQNFTMPVQKEMLENDYFDLDTLEEVHNWNEIDVSTLLSKDIAIGSASTDEYYVFQIPLCSETQRAKEVLCEKFKFLGFETASISRKEEGITINTDAKRFGRVWIKASRLSEKSITAFLNWCSEENIIVKVLIEDVEERLPMTAEQIAIAKQIKNTLISYKDTTHVYSEDKLSPIFKCSAIADMTAMLDNLQAQILAEEV